MRFALPFLLVLCACGGRSLRVVMNAENNTGQSGTALLTELGKGTRVAVVIGKSDDPREELAHLHEGRCGELGPVKASLTALKASPEDAAHFSSSTDIDVAFDEATSGRYAINVHDVRDPSLYVACGDIK